MILPVDGSVAASTANPASSLSIDYPAGAVAGHYVLLWVHCGDFDSTPGGTPTLNTPSGWTSLQNQVGGNHAFGLFGRWFPGAGSVSVTWSRTTSLGDQPGIYGVMLAFAGVDPDNPVDTSAVSSYVSGSASSHTCPSVTTSVAGCYVANGSVNFSTTAKTFTWPGGVNELSDTNFDFGDNFSSLGVAGRTVAASGSTGTTVATFSASASRSFGSTVALRPAPEMSIPVINGGFEDGWFDQWQFTGLGWDLDTTNPHSGTQCARLTDGQAAGGMSKYQIPLESWDASPGEIWIMRGWFRNESFAGAGGLRLFAFVSGAWQDAAVTEAESIGSTWTQQTASAVMPAGTTKVAARIAFAGSGVINVDDITLARIGPLPYAVTRVVEDTSDMVVPASNGDFASGLTGWTTVNGAGDSVPAVNTTNPHSGTNCIKFVCAGGNSSMTPDVGVAALPGQQWAVAAWFRNESMTGLGGLRLQYRTGGVWTAVSGTGVSNGHVDVQMIGNTWEKRQSLFFTIPAGADAIRARIAFGGATGTINVDDVEMILRSGPLFAETATAEEQGPPDVEEDIELVDAASVTATVVADEPVSVTDAAAVLVSSAADTAELTDTATIEADLTVTDDFVGVETANVDADVTATDTGEFTENAFVSNAVQAGDELNFIDDASVIVHASDVGEFTEDAAAPHGEDVGEFTDNASVAVFATDTAEFTDTAFVSNAVQAGDELTLVDDASVIVHASDVGVFDEWAIPQAEDAGEFTDDASVAVSANDVVVFTDTASVSNAVSAAEAGELTDDATVAVTATDSFVGAEVATIDADVLASDTAEFIDTAQVSLSGVNDTTSLVDSASIAVLATDGAVFTDFGVVAVSIGGADNWTISDDARVIVHASDIGEFLDTAARTDEGRLVAPRLYRVPAEDRVIEVPADRRTLRVRPVD